MSWFTDANCQAEAEKGHIQIAYAVDFHFLSGHVRFHTGLGDLILGADTYTGLGSIAGIGRVPDRVSLTAEKWTYQVSYVDPAAIPESEIDSCFRRTVTEYEVWINPDTKAVIGYEINREGTMAGIRRMDGEVPIIQVDCEGRLVILEQSDGLRYTDEHQKTYFFSGDTGCNQVGVNETTEIIWNGSRQSVGTRLANMVLHQKR